MSSRDSYVYSMAAEAQQRAEAAARAREMGRQNAALASLLYARSLSESAAYRTNVDALVREQSRVLAAVDHQLADALAKSGEISAAADRARQLASSIDESLARTQAALRHNMQRAEALQTALGVAASGLQATMRDAHENLTTIENASSASAAFADVVVDGVRRGNMERAAIDASLSRIDQLDRELAFVVRAGAYDSAAMATLLAMEANGYQLRDVTSGEELVSTFEDKDSARRIEVRLAKVGLAESEQELWTLAAETHDMHGEECLRELADFETALVEELDLGQLQLQSRHYPKHDPKMPQRSRDGKAAEAWQTNKS
jgi:hypothetical protein